MLHSVDMEPLSFLVIDEAAQLRESESTIPLQLPDIKHAILIGDECQLPATVASNVSAEAGFGRSLFERLSTLGHSWKQHANTDVANTEDIYKAEQVFLESCARHFHEIQDSKSMMKFVRTFQSMDLKRKFLKSLNCLNELMLLEEESRNFLDAASIANQRGDILLAADLLQKAENFKEASAFTLNTLPWSHTGTTEPKALPQDFFASPFDLDFTADDIMEEYSNMMINLGRFWKIVGALNLVEHEKYHMSIELNAPTIKVLVEITVRNHCTAKEFVGNEDEVQSVEAESMVEELRQLLAALDVSELELKKNVSTIGELLKKLQLRKETMEPFLNSLFSQLYALMKSMDLISDAECSDSDDKGKMVASSAIGASGNNGSKQENENKGKGKNKSKQKQKKKKGQKWK